MSALEGLLRVHRWILEERRQRLSDLEAFADKLRGELAALERHMTAAGGLPARDDVTRRTKLLASIAELEREVQVARDDLKETYEDIEQAEQAERARIVSKVKRRPRRERLAQRQPEIGIYRRRRAVGS